MPRPRLWHGPCQECGAPTVHAKGLCRACYMRTRPRWPAWLDHCLECGRDADVKAYRSHGVCCACAYEHGQEWVSSFEVVARYLGAKWKGRTLEECVLYLARREGGRDIARVLGVSVDTLRLAVNTGGPMPVQWWTRLARFVEEKLVVLPPDH